MRFSSDDLQALARTLQLPSLLRGVFAEQTRAQLWEGNDHPQAETACSDVTVRARVRRGWARVGTIIRVYRQGRGRRGWASVFREEIPDPLAGALGKPRSTGSARRGKGRS